MTVAEADPSQSQLADDTAFAGAEAAIRDPEGEDLEVGYQVALDGFAGPLDLLLYLVRRAEVDITEIPIVEITDQFIATVTAWEELDLDVAGDFILMAATLLEMKARIIMPPDEDDDADEDDEEVIDPRADLISQLLAYRRVKECVLELADLEDHRRQLHFRRVAEDIPEDPEEADSVDLENADPFQLFLVWEEVLASIAAQAPRTVFYDDVPIEERMRQMEGMMAEAGEAKLVWFLERVDSPIQRCGVVVALLECIRKQMVEANQYEQFGDVHLRYLDDDDRRRQAAPPVASDGEEDGTDAEGKKRRRRRKRPPLYTYRQAPIGPDGEQEMLPQVEEEIVVETDEQRFLSDLNKQFGIDSLIQRVKCLDSHLRDHFLDQGIDLPEGEFDHLDPERDSAETASFDAAASQSSASDAENAAPATETSEDIDARHPEREEEEGADDEDDSDDDDSGDGDDDEEDWDDEDEEYDDEDEDWDDDDEDDDDSDDGDEEKGQD